jgi:hypothetical protein
VGTVHLKDGTVFYGFPRRYTDDPREHSREIYLTYPMTLTDTPGGQAFVEMPRTEGILIESANVLYVQIIQPTDTPTATARSA